MIKETRNSIHPVLLKFGVTVVVSLGGLLFSVFGKNLFKPSQSPPSTSSDSRRVEFEMEVDGQRENDANSLVPNEHEDSHLPADDSPSGLSPSGTSTEEKEGILLPEFDEILKEFDISPTKVRIPEKHVEPLMSATESPTGYNVVKMEVQEKEIKNLRNLVNTLKKRESALEDKLLEYYGLKEQESAVMELRNRLKISNTEAKLFTLKIESLQADNKQLEAQVKNYRKVAADLEAAKAQIKLLTRKLRSEAEQNKEQILSLKQRVTKMQEQKPVTAKSNADMHSMLQKIKVLEEKIEELRKSNYNLQLGNQSLDPQYRANLVQDNEEVGALKAEGQHLRKQNEDLTKEIEQLQEDRCADVEELVYLRWINACLRYELRNYQPSQGKTAARDLSRTLSPKSEEKAKQLILEYADKEGLDGRGINGIEIDLDHSSSSLDSYVSDSGYLDDSSVDHSSATKNNTSSRRKMFAGLMKLLRGHGHNHSTGSSQELPASVEDVVGQHSTDFAEYNYRVPTETDGKISRSRASYHSSFRDSPGSPSRLSLESTARSTWDYYKPLYLQELRIENSTDDVGSSSVYENSGFSSDVANSPLKHQTCQELEKDDKNNLLKYAGALIDTRGKKTSRPRRKSASFSSL
ncbi:Actin binding protein family [Heracleum sosnowskyi]|uniref:Actin binding protein family n=1 Tax=Heracleum sosnowskyi TaxID=360622 RepID=A0AAD8I0S2_9APIA|nr:Actin binding protein family [Heracleum sosnowskyi]